MRVLVTGASGHIASEVIPALLSAGHAVTGLARSDGSAETIAARGAEVRRGDLDDLEGLAAAARNADGVVHLAFKHDEQHAGNLQAAVAADVRAIETIGEALKGSSKPFVGTNATLGMALAGFDGLLTESDTLPRGPRIDSENALVALAEDGVRSSVIRLPPAVHSLGRYGFVSALIMIARARGLAGYLEDGSNRWPAASTRDVGRLYRLALESAPAAARLHATGEDGIPMREIAATIGRLLGVPVASVPPGEVEEHFGHVGAFVGLDNPTSSHHTRDTLGWTPTGTALIADLEQDPALRGAVGSAARPAPLTGPHTNDGQRT